MSLRVVGHFELERFVCCLALDGSMRRVNSLTQCPLFHSLQNIATYLHPLHYSTTRQHDGHCLGT